MLQTILAFLGTLAGLVAVALNRRYEALDQRTADISQARKELAGALAAKKFNDAAFWSRRLADLTALPSGSAAVADSTPVTIPEQPKP